MLQSDNIFQTNQSLFLLLSLCFVLFFFSSSSRPTVVEVKSSLPSGMQSPVGAASEQRGGGVEGGESLSVGDLSQKRKGLDLVD